MNYLSVCSGIEAATVAWHSLGWKPVAFSEIERFPAAVLSHHYPDTPNWGDMTRFKEWPDATVDVLVGGTPCQSFSVAGLRKGLDDPRGNLALTFLALAERYRPRWIVWENVPGVLSSSGGRDFGSFLGGLVELGYGFAYRVLDAQYFGVAQRRRRVFVVGCLGDWRGAAAVLLEPEGLRGDSAPSREEGEGVTGTLKACAGSGGWSNSADHAAAGLMVPEISPSLNARDFKGPASDGTGCGAPLVPVSFPWQQGGGMQMSCDENISGTLVKNQTQAVAFTARDYGADATDDLAPTMRSISNTDGHQAGSHGLAVAFKTGNSAKARSIGLETEISPTAAMQVRRLTPVECERLQGFPDDYTRIPYRNKPAEQCPDGPRYKALGNSMAVPVMEWIGARIQKEVK